MPVRDGVIPVPHVHDAFRDLVKLGKKNGSESGTCNLECDTTRFGKRLCTAEYLWHIYTKPLITAASAFKMDDPAAPMTARSLDQPKICK